MSDHKNDREVVACDGPTLADLREASIDVMLEPYRQRLHELNDDILASVSEAVTIVRDLAACAPTAEQMGVVWRRAVEWTQRHDDA